MKGVVFNLLEETVTRAYGPDTWDDLLEASGASGSYSSLGNYPDAEIEALVAAAGQALNLDRDSVLRWFGTEAIPVLAELYPDFFRVADIHVFMAGINDVIHAEVRKLYPGALCPHFRLKSNGSGDLIMDYLSERNMCALAQGFTEGSALWFHQPMTLEHTACRQKGDGHCTFHIRWSAAEPALPDAA